MNDFLKRRNRIDQANPGHGLAVVADLWMARRVDSSNLSVALRRAKRLQDPAERLNRAQAFRR
ncbi:MAG: hypothetical protein DMF31_12265 [Verrucomicrobia bacterium]|nr:MAG: hypothetical protein DMF31_12265 [Verrucomicrobiota bacterium]